VVERKRGKLHNRLFFKVYFNYAVMIIMFALILSGIYLELSERSTINSFEERLTKQGLAVSKRFTEFIIDQEYSQSLTYLDILKQVGIDDIWSISNPAATIPMNKDMASVDDLENLMTVKEYRTVIEGTFAGKKTRERSYSDIYGYDILIVGVPVWSNGEVCGAILTIGEVDTQAEEIASTKSLVFSAALAALLISFVIAIIFARQLSKPISKMRITALELAALKYETKTGINRKDELGDLARTIDFLTDKLQENEQIRKNLEQMRLDFFANVSHELRTPITVVRAYTETLVDGVVTDEASKQQYYEKMLGECKSMERLVGDLLTLSKMQNPDFVVEKEPVNVVQIFDDVIRAVKTLGDEKNLNIQFSSDCDICLMYGDYDRLRQMFLVICDNAIKFSKEESNIYISIESKGNLVVRIRDEGIGISKEEISNIFDKFYKSKLRQNAKGSGLGLAIAKHIALKHDGTIEVQSEVGVGTEFIFTFKGVTIEELEQ
jgi:signal transduction histidine kinase